jgi:hypothetical protein
MSSKLLWVVWAIIALAALPCHGEQDPGTADTVRIGCPVVMAFEPDSMAVPIYLWNDEPLEGLTLGFRIVPNSFQISSWKVDDTDIPPITQANLSVAYHADSSTVLLGWVDFSATHSVAATTALKARRLVTLYLRCSPSSPASVFRFDSTFVPPAGWFLLADTSTGTGFVPLFFDCELLIVGVDEGSATGSAPTEPALKQNSPNPFNSSTAITFDVPRPSNVQLDVINVLGENVATLIERAMPQGRYEVVWDGRDRFGIVQPSGVYFYRLVAGRYTETKKMVLLK